jgi:formylglycine-generating enzyme required for sulfatase activity
MSNIKLTIDGIEYELVEKPKNNSTTETQFVRIPGGGSIRTFEMAITPVTIGQYKQHLGYASSVFHKGPDNHPMTDVSWYDAKAYCDARGYRLPTDAEWEYACRFGAFYPSLGELYEFAVYGQTEKKAVMTKKPNNLGLYDMLGQVYEWTSTEEGSERVIRGGSWDSDARYVRSAYRLASVPSDDWDGLGFRCARDVK